MTRQQLDRLRAWADDPGAFYPDQEGGTIRSDMADLLALIDELEQQLEVARSDEPGLAFRGT